MPLSFPPVRTQARPAARRWRSRGRNQCSAQIWPPAAAGIGEAMEKLATADDIAAAVQATGPSARPA